jgi:hypothetical protein
MKKLLFILSATILSLAAMAQLNPYAYGLSSSWDSKTQMLTVNFKLNAKTSKKIIIYAVDPNNKNTKYKIHEIASPGEKLDFSENIHIIGKLWGSNTCLPVNKDLTFAVEVSGERTTPGTPIYTANRPFSPHGVAVNNCQDSQDFGAVYVTECTNGVSDNATWGWLSNKGRSLLKYSPQLKYEDFYRKSSDFSLRNGTTLLEPHRVVVSDDGRIFVSSNNRQDKDGNPIVWEFDPQTREFTTIVKHNSSYGHRVVAIDVKGSGNNIKMLVCYLRMPSSGNYGYHVYEYSIGAKETIATVVGEECQYVPMGDNNYYQNTLVNCCNNKWFHYSDGFMDVAYGAEDPTTVFMGLDFFINKANNRVALVYFNAALPQEDRYTYLNSDIVGRPDGHHAGGGGLVTYLDHNGNERIAMGRCQTANSQESDGRIQLYALSGNALTDQKCPITTNTRSIINDLAIDCANNLYAVSFTDAVNSTATGTGTLLAVPMPYSGTVTTYCPSSNAPANKYFKLPARTNLPENITSTNLQTIIGNNSPVCDCDISLYRPMQADMFNTICLPFDLDLSSVASLSNADLMEFSGATLEDTESGEKILTLNFSNVSPKNLKAYKPYLIKPTEGISSLNINDVKFVASGTTTVTQPITNVNNNSITFKGIVPSQTVTPKEVDGKSLTMMLVSDNRLAMMTEEGTMPGFRGYFEFENTPPQGMQARISTSKNTTTGTEVVIDGQKVNIEKFLREGRVYIRMGETLYTITGEIVE